MQIEKKSNPPKGKRTVYFSFCHPDVNPGGAQAVAKRLHDEHIRVHGEGSSLFLAASIGTGPNRSAGSNLIQVAKFEFIYICTGFDYLYFTNHDTDGQEEILKLIESFDPTVLHFHHFMGFGIDFIYGALNRFKSVPSIFTIHEHLLVCHNDGHLVQNGNHRICESAHAARCATCLPAYRYDYFIHRNSHLTNVLNLFSCVTAVSKFTADVIAKSMDLDKEIKVIPNGPVMAPKKIYENPISDPCDIGIAYIGQIHKTKGVHLLLDAMEMISEANPEIGSKIHLSLWGAIVLDTYKEILERQLATLQKNGVEARLRGVYASDNLDNVLKDASIVVVPSMWPESYCLTADEALALGKHLICADFPAARERFEEGGLVHFVPPGNSRAIKSKILEIISNDKHDLSIKFKQSYGSYREVFDLYDAISA